VSSPAVTRSASGPCRARDLDGGLGHNGTAIRPMDLALETAPNRNQRRDRRVSRPVRAGFVGGGYSAQSPESECQPPATTAGFNSLQRYRGRRGV
jgi:hypothetical protein